GIGFGVFLLVFWQLLAMAIGKSYVLPKPSQVIGHIVDHADELFLVHLPATMSVVAVGCLFAVVLGFLLAVVMDWDHRIEKALYPILTATQTIPTMCIAPVFVLWFGYTMKMRVIVVILVNFFSVTVNVFDGFKATSLGRMELMQTYGATRMQQFLMLRLMRALPNFFTSLRIAVPWSVVGAAVAEWLGAQNGLGTYSRACMMGLDAAGLIAPLVILTVVALVLNGILGLIEKRVITWKGEA
ncbi:MAG: ABC transporter permease, partial [Lachnospiraceae bacterium]|nr:ABC transporter permease [Lachnospiraceae bacterium]